MFGSNNRYKHQTKNIQLNNNNTIRHIRSKNEHNNKHKMCNFIVVPGNRQALLGLPENEILHTNYNIQHSRCRKADKDANCSTNKPVTHVQEVSRTMQI